MKIVAVCGMGLGSSLVLRLYIEEALREAGISAQVEAVDMGSAQASKADLFITSSELVEGLRDKGTPVIEIKNLLSKKEIKEKVAAYFAGGGQ